jgi:hypothetical protein
MTLPSSSRNDKDSRIPGRLSSRQQHHLTRASDTGRVDPPRGFLRHPRFRRLVHQLGIPTPHALGCLICLWDSAAANPEAVYRDELDIELCADWPGERGRFCTVLLACGFIRRRASRGYEVVRCWEGGGQWLDQD